MSIQPSFEDFAAHAANHRIVPVWRSLLADQVTPVAIFARCVGEDDGFLLESVENGERWSRWSFLGRNPLATVRSEAGNVTVSGPFADEVPVADGMLATLEVLLERFESPEIDGLPPLHSGLMGYLGYDIVREVERLPNVPTDDPWRATSSRWCLHSDSTSTSMPSPSTSTGCCARSTRVRTCTSCGSRR